jgi:hypothetical protein
MLLAGIYAFYAYPSQPPSWVILVALAVPIYYVILSLWMQRKEKRAV